MEDIAEACTSPRLRQAFEQHMQETERQVERLEKVAGMLDVELDGEECEAMEGPDRRGRGDPRRA
jgi:ferritin-like metal-binding protein YciE